MISFFAVSTLSKSLWSTEIVRVMDHLAGYYSWLVDFIGAHGLVTAGRNCWPNHVLQNLVSPLPRVRLRVADRRNYEASLLVAHGSFLHIIDSCVQPELASK